jgi:hypothetical protein
MVLEPNRAWIRGSLREARSFTVCAPSFASFSPVTLPTPGKRPTGKGSRNASMSSGWMTNSPSGLRQSEASLAKNLLGATPAEAVRFNSSRICSPDGARHQGSCRQAGLVLGDVEICFVQRQWFYQVGVALEDLPHAA